MKRFDLPALIFLDCTFACTFGGAKGAQLWPLCDLYRIASAISTNNLRRGEIQAQKFAGEPDEEEIRMTSKPAQAASMGRDRKRPLRRDWESVKEQVMLDALRAKFTQHDEAKAVLLGTGDAKLVEHTVKDSYWGDGGDGSGKNRLGQLLMKLREELRQESTQPPAKAGG
ncbi:MAG: NADAR domain-containing protein [Planctomycetes bacterium]|nr:NADAR domain-containing protein [Planctomycetota bacterium]